MFEKLQSELSLVYKNLTSLAGTKFNKGVTGLTSLFSSGSQNNLNYLEET